jgi:hypothetical protein
LRLATQVADGREEPTGIKRRKQRFESNSDSMSDSSSDSDINSAEGRTVHPKHGEMPRVSSLIFEHIRSLYKVSALLRRPKVQDKYIRSVTKDSGRQRALHFAAWDQEHVAEKMWQWALDLNVKYESRIGGTNYICARAAAANMRRREQLSYWQKHPDVTEKAKQTPKEPGEETFVDRLKQRLRPPGIEVLLSTSLLDSDLPQMMTTLETSQKTAQSFSTVAQSVLNDNETFSGRPKTIYAPSMVGASRGARVPNPPSQLEGTVNFECPYCLTTLNWKSMQQRVLWK